MSSLFFFKCIHKLKLLVYLIPSEERKTRNKMSMALSPYEQRIGVHDFLVTNGVIFSLYTDKNNIQKLFDGSASSPFYDAIFSNDIIQKASRRATHFFTVSVQILDTETGMPIKRVALGACSVYAPINKQHFEIDVLFAENVHKAFYPEEHSDAYKNALEHLVLKYPSHNRLFEIERLYENYEGPLSRNDFMKEQIEKEGIIADYKQWQIDSFKVESIDYGKPRVEIKPGFGVILMREVLYYFLNKDKTCALLEAADGNLVPYYQKYGFELVHKSTTNCSNATLATVPSDAKIPNGYKMALLDLRKGCKKAQIWAQSKVLRVKDPFWEQANAEDYSSYLMYPNDFCQQELCKSQANFFCGRCTKTMYCSQKCAETDWEEKHQKTCV